MAGRRATWLTRWHDEDGAVEQPGEDGVQGRADGHVDHLAGADFPGLVLAGGQVDREGDQQADDRRRQSAADGGLAGLEAFDAQHVADQQDDQGKDRQDDQAGASNND